MCGIAGIFNLDGAPVSAVLLRNMTDAIQHRGPDGEGHIIDGNLGLGHRRLAIIDLSPAGHQPMQTPDGRFVITYNGEVYNFKELRLELESLGYQFHSRTDTEVVLKAYAAWGTKSFLRLNGMFAFAIWDRVEKKLILVRDRYGVKPIYYTLSKNRFIFASEIKALLASTLYQAEINQAGLCEYLTFQNFFTDQTLFKNVKTLSQGCYLEVDLKTQKITRYWDFDFTGHMKITELEALEELDRLFRQSVNRQLISDVPVNCYLSGGIDSGAITMLASQQIPHMRTFTVGFDLSSASGLELSFDERLRAEHVSYLAKTEHYEMVLKAGDMERAMQSLVWHLEEPRVGQSYPNFYAAKLASKFGKVVLAGTGGDELFGGYPWRYYRDQGNVNFETYVDHYYAYWQRLVSHADLPLLLKPIWQDVQGISTRDIFEDVFKTTQRSPETFEDYINRSLYFEAKTFLNSLLILDDKLGMAHSLETRVPFLDNDLVDFAMKLPVNLKLDALDKPRNLNENILTEKLERRREDGKKILRTLVGKYLPETVSKSPKQGFSAPDASWFRGESIDYVRESLFSENANIYNYLDKKLTHSLINEHVEGKQNRRLLVWSLLYLEEFLKVFVVKGNSRIEDNKNKSTFRYNTLQELQ